MADEVPPASANTFLSIDARRSPLHSLRGRARFTSFFPAAISKFKVSTCCALFFSFCLRCVGELCSGDLPCSFCCETFVFAPGSEVLQRLGVLYARVYAFADLLISL
jgi:hypothetical protein